MSMSNFYVEVSLEDFEKGIAEGQGCCDIASENSMSSYDSSYIGTAMSMLGVDIPIVITDSDGSGMCSEWSYPQEIEKTITQLKAVNINIDFSEHDEEMLECCGIDEESEDEIIEFFQGLIKFYENALKNGSVVVTYIA